MKGGMPCFNPLFIGAWVRTWRRKDGSVYRLSVVSIPSSSGPGFGRGGYNRACRSAGLVSIPSSSGPGFGHGQVRFGRQHRTGFNPLFIGAWVRTRAVKGDRHNGFWFQSPLHRGLGSDVHHFIWLDNWSCKFQSPLHRGLGSDQYRHAVPECHCNVSIPSSSGPGFGRSRIHRPEDSRHVSIPSSSGPGFGRKEGDLPLPDRKVSIPSSSGPGFGQERNDLCYPGIGSFNPLFIGAWVRTEGREVMDKNKRVFQSPLHRGLGSDSVGTAVLFCGPKRFQSPLHRGLGSDFLHPLL